MKPFLSGKNDGNFKKHPSGTDYLQEEISESHYKVCVPLMKKEKMM